MSRLDKKDQELLTRVNEVLHYLWDPIGVSGCPSARDEYDSYALQIFSFLKKKSSQEEITNYLTKITVDRMGLNKNAKHDAEIAGLLIDWMKFCEEKEK